MKRKKQKRNKEMTDGKKERKTERKKPIVQAKIGAHTCNVRVQHIFTYGGATHQ